MSQFRRLKSAAQIAVHKVTHPEDDDLIRRIKSARLTYLSDQKLFSIARTVRGIEKASIGGMIVEAGCALGGSTILAAMLKRKERPFNVYDVFGTIPAPTIQDPVEVHARYKKITTGQAAGIDGDMYYGYISDLIQVVQLNLGSFGIDPTERRIRLVKGLVQDTLHINEPIAFAHIDVDWYDPVITCLQRIAPNLTVGGSIILDDYHDWGGCRKATDEFLAQTPIRFSIDDSPGSMRLTRVR